MPLAVQQGVPISDDCADVGDYATIIVMQRATWTAEKVCEGLKDPGLYTMVVEYVRLSI
jgi:hypothetical protein